MTVITEAELRKVQSLFAACMVGDLKGVVTILNHNIHDINGNNIYGLDIDPKGYGRRPIHAATIGGSLDIVKFLIANGADINVKSTYGDTALHFAVHHNRFFILKLLLESKADPSIQNNVQKTPINIANDQNKGDFVQEIEKYVKISQLDTEKNVLKKLLERK